MHIDTVYIYIGQGWIRLTIAQINPLLGHSQEAKAPGKGRTSPVGMKKKEFNRFEPQPDNRTSEIVAKQGQSQAGWCAAAIRSHIRTTQD